MARVIGWIVWAVLALYPLTVHAATRTVCASGCGYTTIGAALTAADSDDIVEIQDSRTYTENVYNDADTGLVLRGAVGQRPTIQQSGVAAAIVVLTDGTIQNVDIVGTGTSADGIRGVTSITVVDVAIRDISGAGINGAPNAPLITATRLLVDNVTGTGIACASTSAGSVTDAIVTRSGGTGIICANAAASVRHSTVVGATGGTYGIYSGTVKYCVVQNNYASTAGIRAITAHSYNLSYGHATNFYGGAGTGDISQDALFTDEGNRDLTLQATSPAIDTAVGSTNSTDYAGLARTGCLWDMGAHEYQYTAPVLTLWTGAAAGSLYGKCTVGRLR